MLEDNDVTSGTLGHSNHTASGTTCAGELARTVHVVDRRLRWVNLAGKTLAIAAFTLDLNTEIGLYLSEWSGFLQIDRVPADL